MTRERECVCEREGEGGECRGVGGYNERTATLTCKGRARLTSDLCRVSGAAADRYNIRRGRDLVHSLLIMDAY